jgi:hypothetical protein
VATMYYCVRSCTSPGLSRVQGRRYTGKRAGRCGEGKGNGGINLVVKLRRSARAAARPAGSRLTAAQWLIRHSTQGARRQRKIKGAQQAGRLFVDPGDGRMQCR